MNPNALVDLASRLGQPALWAIFIVFLLLLTAGRTIHYVRIIIALRRSRVTAMVEASEAVRDIGAMNIPDELREAINRKILSVAGIEPESSFATVDNELASAHKDTKDNRNILLISFLVSLFYIPLTILHYKMTGWSLEFHASFFNITRRTGNGIDIPPSIPYSSSFFATFVCFIIIRLFLRGNPAFVQILVGFVVLDLLIFAIGY
jgi:hypothetical protein